MKVAMIIAETVRMKENKELLEMLDLCPETEFFQEDVVYGYHGNPLEEIINAANEHNPDILIAPEFFFYHGTPYTETEKNNALKCIQGNVRKKGMLILPGTFVWQKDGIMRNSCPIIAGGEVTGEYFKAEDSGDAGIAVSHGCVYEPGKESGMCIDWNGKEIGLEICADHDGKRLLKRDKLFDMHVVISAGMTLSGGAVAAKNKGYALLCDGNELCDAAIVHNKMLTYLHGNLEGNVKIYNIGRSIQ